MDLCLLVIQCSPPDVRVHAKYLPDCTTWLDSGRTSTYIFSNVATTLTEIDTLTIWSTFIQLASFCFLESCILSLYLVFSIYVSLLCLLLNIISERGTHISAKNALLQCPPNKRTNLVIISLNMPFCIHFITNKKYQNKLSTYIYKTLGCPIYMQMYTHRLCGTVISYNCRILFRCNNKLIPYIQCRMHCSAVFGEL